MLFKQRELVYKWARDHVDMIVKHKNMMIYTFMDVHTAPSMERCNQCNSVEGTKTSITFTRIENGRSCSRTFDICQDDFTFYRSLQEMWYPYDIIWQRVKILGPRFIERSYKQDFMCITCNKRMYAMCAWSPESSLHMCINCKHRSNRLICAEKLMMLSRMVVADIARSVMLLLIAMHNCKDDFTVDMFW